MRIAPAQTSSTQSLAVEPRSPSQHPADCSSFQESSISRLQKPSLLWQVLSVFFRMCTFVLSLILFRTPKVQPFYIPDMKAEQRKQYKKEFSNLWPWQLGPSVSQQVELYHQLNSYISTLPAWFVIARVHPHFALTNCYGTIEIDINGEKINLLIDPSIPIEGNIRAWNTFIQDPKHYEKGKDTVVNVTFTLEGVFDPGIGPYRKKKCVLTTRNILGADGKSFTSEVGTKRLRTSYYFFK